MPSLTKRDQKLLGGFSALVLLTCCVGAFNAFGEDDDPVTPPRSVVATTPARPAPTTTAAVEAEVTEEAFDEPEPTKTTSKPKPKPKPKPVRTTEEPDEVQVPEEAQDDEENDVYYRNCSEARADGAAPLYRGDPGYRPGLDRDGDGDACE